MPDTNMTLAEEAADALANCPDAKAVDCFFADLSGVVRGKRYPIDQLDKILKGGLAFPGSVFLLDTKGESHDPNGRGFSDGDPDCKALPLPGTLKPAPWSKSPLVQVMLTLEEEDGTPYYFEPRNVLKRVVERFKELGLTPVVAMELEFYLIDPELLPGAIPQPPISPLTGERDHGTQVYGMTEVDAYADLLDEISEACDAQEIPTGAISAEYAPGQFEINLHHEPDPLDAADHCVMFKRVVKGVAKKHGMRATFMAKPYPDQAGSGLHMHISLLDKDGKNVFDGGSKENPASPMLLNAIGGILKMLPESMAILAPNANSYRRFAPDIFVPIARSWGYENRSVALRIPLGEGDDRRIEHRMAGADANPYLALATALAGIHYGIVGNADPGPEWTGNAGIKYDEGLTFRPRRSLEVMQEGTLLSRYLGDDYVQTYAACKLAEVDRFESEITSTEYRWYLQAD
ncbi:glutamine synthetase family protein [Limibacillus halophilus]